MHKHKHGHVYRAKIASHDGRVEYSEWFNTEDDLRDSMRGHNGTSESAITAK